MTRAANQRARTQYQIIEESYFEIANDMRRKRDVEKKICRPVPMWMVIQKQRVDACMGLCVV